MHQIYAHPESGRVWRRSGDCNRCGECCSGDPFNGELGTNVIDGIVSCPILRKQGDGTSTCSDRGHPYYLNGCNVFPQFPEQVANYPSCSYVFTLVEP